MPDLISPLTLDKPSPVVALQALSVMEAMELARKVLNEISTTGGKYGHQFGDIVYDSTQAEYALRSAMEKLNGTFPCK